MPGFEDTLEAPCGRCGTLLSVCARVALHPLEPGVPAGQWAVKPFSKSMGHVMFVCVRRGVGVAEEILMYEFWL